MFLFSAYHVVYIYCAVKGKRGFAFYNLPVFRWLPDGRRIPFINHIIIHSCEDKENSKTVYLVVSASSFWSHVYIGKDLLKQNWMQHDTCKKKNWKIPVRSILISRRLFQRIIQLINLILSFVHFHVEEAVCFVEIKAWKGCSQLLLFLFNNRLLRRNTQCNNAIKTGEATTLNPLVTSWVCDIIKVHFYTCKGFHALIFLKIICCLFK